MELLRAPYEKAVDVVYRFVYYVWYICNRIFPIILGKVNGVWWVPEANDCVITEAIVCIVKIVYQP